MNDIPKIAMALAALYIITVVLTGMVMLGSATGFLLIPRAARLISFLNFVVALGAVVFLLASALVATIGPREVADQIAKNGGNTVGIEVIANTKLAALAWAAFALMVVSMFFWFYELVVVCVRRRRVGAYGEKPGLSASSPYSGK